MRTRTVRTGTLVVVLATAGFALAACGSNDGTSTAASSSGTPATSAPSDPTTSAGGPTADPATVGGASGGGGATTSSGSGGTSGSSTSGGSGGKSVPTCTTDQLKTTAVDQGVGAGTAGFQIVFQNTGSAPCAMSGYPGVSFVKIHNIQLGKAASRTTGTPVTTVTLIPNAHAYADVLTVNGQGGYDASTCDLTTVPTLRVYPPNQKESTNIPWNREECVGASVQNLRVGPVHGNK